MRLFIGVPLPEPAARETAGALARLRAQGWPVRWVRDEGLHLTLKFYGEVTSDRIDAIAEALDFAAADTRPLALAPAGFAVFPSARRPRVIHLAVEAGPDLELLQDRVERAGERLGFPPEGRPFRPHVTLGRVREGQRLPADWRRALDRIPPGEGFLADRVVLFESHSGHAGPVYEPRHVVLLA
jgi:RNA 2',3'-cyclic 3'-phosphodiesterase